MNNIIRINVAPDKTTLALEYPISCSCGKQLKKVGDIITHGHGYLCKFCTRITIVIFDDNTARPVINNRYITEKDKILFNASLGLIDERDTCPCHDIILMKAKSLLTGTYVPLICVVHDDKENTGQKVITPIAELLHSVDNYVDPIEEEQDKRNNDNQAKQN